jgi:hypothetical protein
MMKYRSVWFVVVYVCNNYFVIVVSIMSNVTTWRDEDVEGERRNLSRKQLKLCAWWRIYLNHA